MENQLLKILKEMEPDKAFELIKAIGLIKPHTMSEETKKEFEHTNEKIDEVRKDIMGEISNLKGDVQNIKDDLNKKTENENTEHKDINNRIDGKLSVTWAWAFTAVILTAIFSCIGIIFYKGEKLFDLIVDIKTNVAPIQSEIQNLKEENSNTKLQVNAALDQLKNWKIIK